MTATEEQCPCYGATPPPGRRVQCKRCKRVVDNSRHECHATGCTTAVPPRMLMCLKHWKMVPRALQRRVWGAYVEGQEIRKDPTAAYLDVQQEAVQYVARLEGKAT